MSLIAQSKESLKKAKGNSWSHLSAGSRQCALNAAWNEIWVHAAFGALLPWTSSSLTRTWAGDTAEGCAWLLLIVMSSLIFQHFMSEVCSLEKLWVCLIKKWSLSTSQDLVFYCRGIAHGNSCYYLSQVTKILISSGNTLVLTALWQEPFLSFGMWCKGERGIGR